MQGTLCGYGREKHKSHNGIYSRSAKKRQGGQTNQVYSTHGTRLQVAGNKRKLAGVSG